MQLYPQSPDVVWPGHLHGTGCLSARAIDTGFPTVVWCLCLGLGCTVTPPFVAGVYGVCVLVRVLASPCHSRLGFVVRAFRDRFRNSPAIPGWGLGCVRLVMGLAALLHSWLGLVVCACGVGVSVHPAISVKGLLSSDPSAAVWPWWAAAFRLASPGWAGWSSGVLSGGPVGVLFGVACLLGMPASCGVVRDLAVVCPPSFSLFPCWPAGARSWFGGGSPLLSSFSGGGFACSSLCLPCAGAATGRLSVWLTGSQLVLWVAAGHSPAPWVWWVMYTLGLVACPVGLGAGSAGRMVAPDGFMSSWVKGGRGFPVSPRPCSTGLVVAVLTFGWR